MNVQKLPNKVICPCCNYRIGEFDNEGRVRPLPIDGDFTVCCNCGEILNYVVSRAGVFSLRKSRDEDLKRSMEDGFYNEMIYYQNIIRSNNGILN